jgi:predicted alpha/beta hydrolase family esterase
MLGHTVLIVPGLREHVADHWQTLLAARLPLCRSVEPAGRRDLDCAKRVEAIEREARSIEGPILLVAHSAGVAMVAHWARKTTRPVAGALLAAPPDFDRPMPEGYPTLAELDAGGWLPTPRARLPFRSLVVGSRNDPLASEARVRELAADWGSRFICAGHVGHLNPASGFGEWFMAEPLVRALALSNHH